MVFGRIHKDADDHFVKHFAGTFKDIQMSHGYRIKTARANCSSHDTPPLKTFLLAFIITNLDYDFHKIMDIFVSPYFSVRTGVPSCR